MDEGAPVITSVEFDIVISIFDKSYDKVMWKMRHIYA